MAPSPYDQAALGYKDKLAEGASRVPVPVGTPGSVADYYGTPVGRMDFLDPSTVGGRVGIVSGSSEAQPGYTGPAPAGAPASPQASAANLSLYGTNLQQALSGYLQGVKKPEDVYSTLAALRSVGQLHPNLEQSFLAAGGQGLTPEERRRLQELAAQLSVQQGILPTNLG